jgi:AcrR family transcriptional regulator
MNGQTATMTTSSTTGPAASAPRTARERVREEMTAEILAVAATHVARDGAAAISLRSIARDLGMAPSALYRYFDGRDALLSALILSAYEALADEAEQAADEAERLGGPGDRAERWLAVPRAMRRWALAHPHQWGLIFGTPIPGYHAPEDTVVPYTRMAAALVRPLLGAHEDGDFHPDGDRPPISDELRAAVAPVAEGLLPGMEGETVVLLLEAYTAIIGAISLEVFGHWRQTVLEPALLFDATVVQAGETIGLFSATVSSAQRVP